MYKLPTLRDDRRFLRDCKRVPKDAEAFDATTDGKALRGYRERCHAQLICSRYQYRPLDRSRKEIRLLTLEPGSGNSMLHCTLEHAFLDVTLPPLYETISYVCGDPLQKSNILLHGHKVQAMATSEAALRRMRLRNKSRTLWIDSICINQYDTNERGHQVGTMYQIYTNTFRNLIWLGPCDNALTKSIHAMEAILQEIVIETRNYADFKGIVFDNGKYVHRFSNIPLSKTVDCPAFLRLLDNPWFSRLWIVQEASLAPSSICHYGELEVPLMSILRSARWLQHKWYQLPSVPKPALTCLTNTLSIFNSADREYGFFYAVNVPSEAAMANLLSVFGKLQTFDRRDRVFAILGLWQMFTKAAVLPDLLRPNYNLTVGEVFKRAIQYAIEECGNLWPLGWISEPSREAAQDASWPSWVPVIDQGRRGKYEPLPLVGTFNVAKRTRMIIRKDHERPNDLVVSGILLDEITEVTSGVMPDTTASDIEALVVDLERPRCESWVETNAGGLETKIGLVLLGGRVRGARVAHQEALQGYQSFKAFLRERSNLPLGSQELACSASDKDKSATEYWHDADRRLYYRAVFHTTTGHMGLGPRCAQPGDVVAILYGSKFPMVMRPLPELPKGSYSLLGTSYVYGIMDGEAVQRHKDMRLEDDVFRIV